LNNTIYIKIYYAFGIIMMNNFLFLKKIDFRQRNTSKDQNYPNTG